MDLDFLRKVLDLDQRADLYQEIITFFREIGELDYFEYQEFDTHEGMMPVVFLGRNKDPNLLNDLHIFVAAQHNEYNGLLGIIRYLKMIQDGEIDIKRILRKDQLIILFPLMNPYGFLHPSKYNKSGYYLKNGSNLNRFWRRTFAPEHKNSLEDSKNYKLPTHAAIFKELIENYWENEKIRILLVDCHETSLLERFPRELSLNLTPYYKFDHWLKEGVIKNIIELSGISYYRKPLFYKCNPSADHNHINLSIKQIDLVFEKLLEYLAKNKDKLAFYYCYSDKGKEITQDIASKVYNNLSDILWETRFPAFDHHFDNHGCFVKMSDATSRDNIFCIELESQKQFFDIFEELEKKKTNRDYIQKKAEIIEKSIQLVVETIKQVINYKGN